MHADLNTPGWSNDPSSENFYGILGLEQAPYAVLQNGSVWFGSPSFHDGAWIWCVIAIEDYMHCPLDDPYPWGSHAIVRNGPELGGEMTLS
eukprot:6377747-Prymnesium_polylepis.1